ncbi:hypothetical protein N658DRAFT_284826 [Parathielavia hyrcaniae]|uniref:Secreted peptide n=1 Tax=Parathielavia hyrcaniae TaxID=113614 RepID=A0AAN6QA52_9PEZI|nr:hypothetical protein N658DRAFT_284826 [Parathielavia hyrcaniae]
MAIFLFLCYFLVLWIVLEIPTALRASRALPFCFCSRYLLGIRFGVIFTVMDGLLHTNIRHFIYGLVGFHDFMDWN